jgi:ppGpp synthetase/RelA/SpoT-type nucleotidyltranferase
MGRIGSGDWVLAEKPKAYTWDPESRDFFSGLELEVLVKESFYTSVHYVVKPRVDSDLSCEIQVRTLFEEVWGEIDHQLNYPVESKSIACKEQLRVLARLVGAGSRLADAIFRIHESEKS